MGTNRGLSLVLAVVFTVVLAVVGDRELIGPNSPRWRNLLVCIAWFAALLMAVALTQGFDATPLEIGVLALVGALAGAITGLLISSARERRKAD